MSQHTRTPEQRHPALVLPGILVEPPWLDAQIGAPGLRIVDLRESEAFAESHVPGAVQLDLADLGTTTDCCDNVLLPASDFARLMESLGIGTGDTVIAYDDQWGLAAARLVWALHYYGHQAVSVLDGGWDRWRDEGRLVTGSASAPLPATFEAIPDPELGAETGWLTQRVSAEPPRLIDTRTTVEFEQGHLPDAILWDWFNAVPPGGWDSARDPEELKTEWRSLGIDPSQEIVVYCRSGMRAAHTYMVLKHAGFPRVRLYDGSWQEWSKSK